MGSPTCRLRSSIELRFKKYDGIDTQNFGLDTGPASQVDIHGRHYRPTWTRLAATAKSGADSITVQARERVFRWHACV